MGRVDSGASLNCTTRRGQVGVAKSPAGELKTDRVSLRLTRSEGGKTKYPPLFPAAVAVFVIVVRLGALE